MFLILKLNLSPEPPEEEDKEEEEEDKASAGGDNIFFDMINFVPSIFSGAILTIIRKNKKMHKQTIK